MSIVERQAITNYVRREEVSLIALDSQGWIREAPWTRTSSEIQQLVEMFCFKHERIIFLGTLTSQHLFNFKQ